jgi:sugar O-acyltransferase (sialic acid O-acetyltransferase NeuD family)
VVGEKQHFIMWGASGHAKVLYELILSQHGDVVALFDNQPDCKSPLPGIPVFIGRQGFESWFCNNHLLTPVAGIAAIGGDRGRDRVDYLELFRSRGLKTPSLIHATAYVSDNSMVEDNCQLLAFAMLGVESVLGEATILNTRASVDHECVLGKGVHVAPGAVLCGCIHIGDYSFIGAGAVVLPRITIGSNVIVGAGSVVTRNLPDNIIAYGIPAKIVRKRTKA